MQWVHQCFVTLYYPLSLFVIVMGNLALRCSNTALANPRFPSAFSKSIGFTLCMAEDPTSPSLFSV